MGGGPYDAGVVPAAGAEGGSNLWGLTGADRSGHQISARPEKYPPGGYRYSVNASRYTRTGARTFGATPSLLCPGAMVSSCAATVTSGGRTGTGRIDLPVLSGNAECVDGGAQRAHGQDVGAGSISVDAADSPDQLAVTRSAA